MMQRWAKIAAGIWIVVLILVANILHFKINQIEAHSLPDVLKTGYDAFGRNCIELTLTAILESFKTILPVSLLCMLASLLTVSAVLSRNPYVAFLLRAFLDTLSSLPGFLIALSLSVFFAEGSSTFILGAILMVYPSITRFLEGQILKLQTEEFIKATEAMGASPFYIFYYHYCPELLRMIIAILPFTFTRLILIETSLSFLGLGMAESHETWGRLLYQGKDYFLEAPWILITASLPLFLTLFSFHLLSSVDQN